MRDSLRLRVKVFAATCLGAIAFVGVLAIITIVRGGWRI